MEPLYISNISGTTLQTSNLSTKEDFINYAALQIFCMTDFTKELNNEVSATRAVNKAMILYKALKKAKSSNEYLNL